MSTPTVEIKPAPPLTDAVKDKRAKIKIALDALNAQTTVMNKANAAYQAAKAKKKELEAEYRKVCAGGVSGKELN